MRRLIKRSRISILSLLFLPFTFIYVYNLVFGYLFMFTILFTCIYLCLQSCLLVFIYVYNLVYLHFAIWRSTLPQSFDMFSYLVSSLANH